ncbi:hypothetical protein SPHV1_2270083 [Novosphingobium sp. KN65.2]|nr:hypothetical protein SPHV1_2270083 [Novosphingobium sp. KN65.2]
MGIGRSVPRRAHRTRLLSNYPRGASKAESCGYAPQDPLNLNPLARAEGVDSRIGTSATYPLTGEKRLWPTSIPNWKSA